MKAILWVILLIGAGNVNASTLDVRQRSMIPIAVFIANGNQIQLQAALHQGLDSGLTINEIKEILIQSYAYAGFPRALNGIATFMDVVEQRKARGQVDSTGRSASPIAKNHDRVAFGNQTRNGLVGQDVSNRKTGYAGFVPTIDEFLVSHLFADIFVRDVLTFKERELVTISFLAALPGAEAQLKTHQEICFRIGWSQAQIQEATRIALKTEGEPRMVTITKARPAAFGNSAHFKGLVKVEPPFASGISTDYRGGIVHFAKGAKTAWHTHPRGQTLIVLSGIGWIQQDGLPMQKMQTGDVVWIPANIKHWHGATDDSPMSHVAISAPLNGETVEWMEWVE